MLGEGIIEMAYLHQGPSLKAGTAYNLEQAVGKTGTNAPGDVKLVQYMLRNIYGQTAFGLKVDGYIGPVTISWIERFQNDANAKGLNVLADGRIDRGLAQISTVSKTRYTILAMSAELRRINPGAYQNLPQSVPLNPSPKSSPYNASGGKQVVNMKTVWTTLGKLVTYVFADGTQYPPAATGGKLQFDPPPPEKPGKLIFEPAPPEPEILSVYYYSSMNMTQFIFTNGSTYWQKGPPGGVTEY